MQWDQEDGTNKDSRPGSVHLQWTQGSRGATELGEMKKQNFGLGCPVLSREAQRIMTNTSIREADGRCLLLPGLCICYFLSLEWPFPTFSGSYSLSLSLGISFSIQEDSSGFTTPPHPNQAGLGVPIPPSTYSIDCLNWLPTSHDYLLLLLYF